MALASAIATWEGEGRMKGTFCFYIGKKDVFFVQIMHRQKLSKTARGGGGGAAVLSRRAGGGNLPSPPPPPLGPLALLATLASGKSCKSSSLADHEQTDLSRSTRPLLSDR